jgi:FkbM family methyltransferase
MRRLWRRLPVPLRVGVWRALDRLGAWPVRLTVGPARGLTILTPASRSRGYRDGRYERPVLDLLAERLTPGMEFVDAGAFLGYFTLAAAARVGEEGRVWAFEPNTGCRRLLEHSVRRNGLANVTIDPRALGGRVGSGRLTAPANPAVVRVMPAETGRPEAGAVAVTTLDAWCAESGARPDLVKLDVEGAELEVLEGAAETLRRHRPLLVVEVHRGGALATSPELVVERLRTAGYGVRSLGPNRADDLAGALERLREMSLPPDRVAVAHLLATPG